MELPTPLIVLEPLIERAVLAYRTLYPSVLDGAIAIAPRQSGRLWRCQVEDWTGPTGLPGLGWNTDPLMGEVYAEMTSDERSAVVTDEVVRRMTELRYHQMVVGGTATAIDSTIAREIGASTAALRAAFPLDPDIDELHRAPPARRELRAAVITELGAESEESTLSIGAILGHAVGRRHAGLPLAPLAASIADAFGEAAHQGSWDEVAPRLRSSVGAPKGPVGRVALQIEAARRLADRGTFWLTTEDIARACKDGGKPSRAALREAEALIARAAGPPVDPGRAAQLLSTPAPQSLARFRDDIDRALFADALASPATPPDEVREVVVLDGLSGSHLLVVDDGDPPFASSTIGSDPDAAASLAALIAPVVAESVRSFTGNAGDCIFGTATAIDVLGHFAAAAEPLSVQGLGVTTEDRAVLQHDLTGPTVWSTQPISAGSLNPVSETEDGSTWAGHLVGRLTGTGVVVDCAAAQFTDAPHEPLGLVVRPTNDLFALERAGRHRLDPAAYEWASVQGGAHHIGYRPLPTAGYEQTAGWRNPKIRRTLVNRALGTLGEQRPDLANGTWSPARSTAEQIVDLAPATSDHEPLVDASTIDIARPGVLAASLRDADIGSAPSFLEELLGTGDLPNAPAALDHGLDEIVVETGRRVPDALPEESYDAWPDEVSGRRPEIEAPEPGLDPF